MVSIRPAGHQQPYDRDMQKRGPHLIWQSKKEGGKLLNGNGLTHVSQQSGLSQCRGT